MGADSMGLVSLDERRARRASEQRVLEAVRHWRQQYSSWDAHREHMAAQIALAAAWDEHASRFGEEERSG